MPRTEVRFAGVAGTELVGSLEEPEGPARGRVLFAHCFTCSKDLKAAYWIGQRLAECGLAMLRFDFAGLGQSEGDFVDTTLSSNIEDLVAAARFMEQEHGPVGLIVGHSLGGVATLAAAGRVPSARAVCTISTSFAATHLRRYLVADHGDAAPSEELQVTLAGRSFRLRRSFVEDLARHDMARIIPELGRPLLVLHAPDDRVVEMAQAELIYQAARQPRSIVALDGADHLLTRPVHAHRAADLIAAWALPYLLDPA